MENILRALFLSLTLFICNIFGSFAQNFTAERSKLLNDLVVEFTESISAKDSVRFKKLLFHDNISFVGIMSEKTEGSIKKTHPDFQGVSVSTGSKFIREIVNSKEPKTEKVFNLRINSDGVIGSVSFDYCFLSGDKMIQWGNELWNVVYTEDQWLIKDVVFSIRFPAEEPFPYQLTD